MIPIIPTLSSSVETNSPLPQEASLGSTGDAPTMENGNLSAGFEILLAQMMAIVSPLQAPVPKLQASLSEVPLDTETHVKPVPSSQVISLPLTTFGVAPTVQQGTEEVAPKVEVETSDVALEVMPTRPQQEQVLPPNEELLKIAATADALPNVSESVKPQVTIKTPVIGHDIQLAAQKESSKLELPIYSFQEVESTPPKVPISAVRVEVPQTEQPTVIQPSENIASHPAMNAAETMADSSFVSESSGEAKKMPRRSEESQTMVMNARGQRADVPGTFENKTAVHVEPADTLQRLVELVDAQDDNQVSSSLKQLKALAESKDVFRLRLVGQGTEKPTEASRPDTSEIIPASAPLEVDAKSGSIKLVPKLMVEQSNNLGDEIRMRPEVKVFHSQANDLTLAAFDSDAAAKDVLIVSAAKQETFSERTPKDVPNGTTVKKETLSSVRKPGDESPKVDIAQAQAPSFKNDVQVNVHTNDVSTSAPPPTQIQASTVPEQQKVAPTMQKFEGEKPAVTSSKQAELDSQKTTNIKPGQGAQTGREFHSSLNHQNTGSVTMNTSEPVVKENGSNLAPEVSKSILDQIAKEMSVRIREGSSEVRMTLKPESLGEVVVTMQMEESKLTAQINVDQPAVKNAVEAQMPQLRQALIDRGIEIQRMDVAVADQSLARESRGEHSGGSKRRNEHSLDTVDEGESMYTPRSLGYNTIEILL